MDEFIKKLIEKLEEAKEFYRKEWNKYMDNEDFGNLSAYKDAIHIVNQLAEEHNNGWIPCSVRLPEGKELHRVLVTDEDGVMAVCYFLEVTNVFKVSWDGEEFKDVVAWKPIAPYWQKGE